MSKFLLSIFLFSFIQLTSQVHTLKESIYFGLGKTSLTHSHKKKLDSIVSLLKTSSTYTGEVKGHTCNIGSNRINKVISNLRALNVLNYLVDRGVKRDQFSYTAFGPADPIGDNRTSKGRSLNRRTDVEVVLSLFDEEVSYTEDSKEERNEKGKIVGDSKKEKQLASAPPVELGPDFVSGKIPKVGNKLIKSTNGIEIDVDRNTLVSGSSEPIELDFKDFTQNYDIIKKGFNTSSGVCRNLSLIGAFSVNFTQEYQELSLNSNKPLIVSVPSEFFPNAKLYSNPRNWSLDTINKLIYNYDKKAYEVEVINNTQVIGIFNDVPDTVVFLRVKMKGLDPEILKPYVIYDDCNISMCCRQKGKWFLVPVSTKSQTYRIRSNYTDYSSRNGTSYSIQYDIKNLDLSQLRVYEKSGNTIIYKYPERLSVVEQKLDKSSLCDPVTK